MSTEEIKKSINIRETGELPPTGHMNIGEMTDVFLMKAPKMVGTLLRDCNGNASVALHRLRKHMDSIGEYGMNMPALKIAKLKLEELANGIHKKM